MNTNLKVDTSSSSSKSLRSLVFCISMLALSNSTEVEAKKHKHLPHVSTVSKITEFIHSKYKRPLHQANTIAKAIVANSNKHSLDPAVVTGLIAKESSFKSVNHAGNIGLMQINQKAHKYSGLRNATTNIALGTAILSECLRTEAHGNLSVALSLYNRGCSHSNKQRKVKQGRAYTNRVLREAKAYNTWSN